MLVISFLALFYSCLAENVTHAAKHPKQKKKHRSKRRSKIPPPKKRRKTHTQVWGAALYYMKGCWLRSHNCFFIASTPSISLCISSAIFFILSMTRDFST